MKTSNEDKAEAGSCLTNATVEWKDPGIRRSLENERDHLLQRLSNVTSKLDFLSKRPGFEDDFNDFNSK